MKIRSRIRKELLTTLAIAAHFFLSSTCAAYTICFSKYGGRICLWDSQSQKTTQLPITSDDFSISPNGKQVCYVKVLTDTSSVGQNRFGFDIFCPVPFEVSQINLLPTSEGESFALQISFLPPT